MPATKRSHKQINKRRVDHLVRTIAKAVGKPLPNVSKPANQTEDPFWVLMATMLSHRTKEDVTMAASKQLFAMAPTPGKLARTPIRNIEKTIFPVGFYKTKARTLKEMALKLVTKYNGVVPDSVDELTKIRGVGRKTANMVTTKGYGKYGICVDTHVHRVSNRLGMVATNTPKETEFAMRKVLSKRYWIGCNELLVSFGREICRPLSPLCSQCPLENDCPRIGVTRHR